MKAFREVSVSIGSTYQLSSFPVLIGDTEFNARIKSFTDGTAVRYYTRVKSLIIRGLLLNGQDAKRIPDTSADEIVAGTAENEARIFLVRDQREATLLWRGPKSEYKENYRRIRDEHCGPIAYRLHGRAANTSNVIRVPRGAKMQITSHVGQIDRSALHAGAAELHEQIKGCPGGCLRRDRQANPMLRPPGGYTFPSPIMFILEQPNRDDDQINHCLTIGPEDYASGRLDQTAAALRELFTITGLDYTKIYIVNSLLCWQGESDTRKQYLWDLCWLPCLRHRWLQSIVEACSPTAIVTFGCKALRAVHHISGEPLPSDPIMTNEIGKPRTLRGRHIFPLIHPSPNARQTRPPDVQRRDWFALRDFLAELALTPKARY